MGLSWQQGATVSSHFATATHSAEIADLVSAFVLSRLAAPAAP